MTQTALIKYCYLRRKSMKHSHTNYNLSKCAAKHEIRMTGQTHDPIVIRFGPQSPIFLVSIISLHSVLNE